MQKLLPFLVIFILCACGQHNEQDKTSPNDISIVNSEDSVESVNETKHVILDWEKYQDSLRNEILKRKENKVLKESFLQELYIRNVVRVSDGRLFFKIPFDLHGPDCGAPDCYSTDISFSFKFDDTLVFPKNVQFHEREHGCVDKEINFDANFRLIDETNQYVIYYSSKPMRTLVLFSSNKEIGTTAFYFKGLSEYRIIGKNVYSILNDYNEEDDNAIYPFTSWVLETNEYEHFLN